MSPLDLLILDFDGVCTPPMTAGLGREAAEPWLQGAVSTVELAQSTGVQVAVLSNEIRAQWATEYPVLEIVDHVVNCADNGIYKPDRRAFQRCLLLSGSRAEHTLVVDDDPDNATVAESLGMHACLLYTSPSPRDRQKSRMPSSA